MKSIREATPQALHHFTQADQVNQLVSASEADPDLGFMARMMALCSLPRTNPGNRIRGSGYAEVTICIGNKALQRKSIYNATMVIAKPYQVRQVRPPPGSEAKGTE